MSVAPFLPRTGVPYIPRPALSVVAAQAGAGVVNVTADGITEGRGAGVATLRVFNADGDRVHDLTAPYATDTDEADFLGVTIADVRPHRVEVLTSHGQRGSALINSAEPLPPLEAGTEFEGNEVPSPPPQYPIEIDVYVQGSLVGIPTSAILTINGVPRASEPVTLAGDMVSVKYTVPGPGTYDFTLTLNTGQSGTTDPLVMLPVALVAMGADTTAGASGHDTVAPAPAPVCDPAPTPEPAPKATPKARK